MAENRRACASCGTANDEDARFCEGCGGALGRACGTCGVEANATARFCRACGAPLDDRITTPAESPAAGPSRKTVTVMFADLAGSTTFEEQVDAETAREVMSRYHDLLRSTAERNRAGVTKYIGDGFMAVWGVPEIGPDDADHAVDAAVELQEHFIDFAARATEARGVDLALRVAVNTGEVVVGAGDADLVGDALNVAARLEAECPRGRVVVGEETWRSTRGRHRYESLGHVQVKGRTAPVPVYQWLGRQSESTDSSPFVGRTDEIRRLQTALDDAIAARAARLVTVIGDPGVGKSRLAAEFTAAQGDVRVIEARCDVEGTVALAPIVEVLRARDLDADVPVGVPERDRILRDLNGLTTGVPGSVEETFWALRRYVEVLARDGPLIVVVDDIQWADSLLLDFVEHLAEWVREVPVLVLALARPELREVRADLIAVGRWVTEAVHLGGLDPGATAELAAGVLGAGLPEELLRRLPSSTGGNPLFVRELVGMLVHDGVLVAEPTGWRLTIDVDAIAIPPTIQALLASRLERLNAADRRVLEVASVVGTDFSLGVVCALAARGSKDVKASLDRLRRLDLAQPSGAYLGDEPIWRFHHVLIRDVAYRRLLKSDRAGLHERLADWVEAGGASVAFDSDEMIARHLEAAHGYRLELGTADEHIGQLALRSARCYLASARRALDRDELISAGTQAARGAALAAADEAVHAELLLVGCEAFLSAGDVAAGAPLVDDLDRIAGEALEPWATCYRCQFVVYTDPARLLGADARLQGAIDEFGRRKDPAGLAKAHRVRASARARLGRIGDAEVDLFEALIAARQGGDHRQITAALGMAPSAALWGPSPVPKAGGRCLDVVRMQRMTTAAPSLEATSLRCLAVLELLRGRPDKARSMLADARQVVADLGLRHGLMETELFAGFIEAMVGDQVAAEPHFRTAMEGMDALGVGADAGQAAALLARSVLAQGRIDEADRYATESERIAGHNLKTAIAWRAVRAEILAAQGRNDEAAAMARDAVNVAVGTDLVLDHAEACFALSRVLAAAGDAKGAKDARDDAHKLYGAKEVAATIGRLMEPNVPVASQPTPTAPAPTTSRLAVTNQSCEFLPALLTATRSRDVDGTLSAFSDGFVFDDRRRISGDAIVGLTMMRAAIERIFEQYTQFEFRVLAVRGERLNLLWSRWSDDDGNESTMLYVNETGDDGRIDYQGHFDEDDFEGAYRELERRYYAGAGAAFAQNGQVLTEWVAAMDRFDVEAARSLTQPEFRWLALPTALTSTESSIDEVFGWQQERGRQVSSVRTWGSAIHWPSPNCYIGLANVGAIGLDGEDYEWTPRLYGVKFRDGLLASVREFELDDEESAFTYAEALVTPRPSRLTISNRASESAEVAWRAMRAHDADTIIEDYSDRFVYDDHRRLSGDPIVGLTAMRAALERIFDQYSQFELRILAVRGERLLLASSRWSDDAGNQTSFLHVAEIGDDGRTTYDGRFDADDFEGAYRELEQRYYAGEGAAFAANGRSTIEWRESLDRVDVDAARRLAHPEFRWLAPPSALKSSERSVDELFRWQQERANQVSSLQHSNPVLRWLSPNCNLSLGSARAVGPDGEVYEWTRIYVSEWRDGLLASIREFETDHEEAAFSYTDTLVAPRPTRLAVGNRASESVDAICRALQAHDVDSAVALMSDRFVYDDRRRLSGDSIEGVAELRSAGERLLEQYGSVNWRTLAVRGDRLALAWSRWSDEAGNEATYLGVFEAGDDGRIIHHVRFDGDDADAAYRELERRYYAGEGEAFAASGQVLTQWIAAMDRLDVQAARNLAQPEFRWLTLPSALSSAADLSVDELFRWLQERAGQVSSVRHWASAISWRSPNCCLGLGDARAVGVDGENYEWTRLCVLEFRDGRLASVRQFELDDEDAAFAYADTLVTPRAGRLAVSNRASETLNNAERAMQSHDADTTAGFYAERFTYDDRRRLSGDPINGRAELRDAAERILAQYTRFEGRTLAVRGERSQLSWSLWSDDDGNETTYLRLVEIDDGGRILYEGRFDEDDFEGAYRELDHRYYAGEGATYAELGATLTEIVTAHNRGDLATVFDEFIAPELRIQNRSRSAFPDRSAAELRASTEELHAMFASARMCYSAVCWLSRNWAVARQDREAVGPDGEKYEWIQLYVTEFRDGLATSMCAFDVEDEAAAFAYAEENMRAASSRLALTNRASETVYAAASAGRAKDIDGMFASYSDRFTYDDRRRLSGDPVAGAEALRRAQERILEQYSRFDVRTLAVRGEQLHLGWGRWSDDAGNETAHLYVHEVDESGRIAYEGRFDEDDFESAYRELERRYYTGQGAAFAEGGSTLTDTVIAVNSGDLDRAFRNLASPAAVMENRSRSVFGDRSAEEYRASIEELQAMVASSRVWYSAVCWLSPAWVVTRAEREAVGRDGEQYTWTKTYALEILNGQPATACEFDLEDEESAFAYAEERLRATSSRLAVTNHATEVGDRLLAAFRARNVDAALDAHSDQFVYDDRRRLAGDPLVGRPGLRAAHERVFEQYSVFDGRTLAVRGERLQLSWSRWSDDAGNATTNLHVFELGDDGRISFHGRFEEDDFDAAYRELERRYYAGEGAAYAESGALNVEYTIALNRGDFDTVFGELTTPDMHVQNRSRSIFPDRSAAELRASLEELNAMVASARNWQSAMLWLSPNWAVARQQREAVGLDGERYEWTRFLVAEYRDGRLASLCEFDVQDEEAAFAYAEERVRADSSRLALTNRATEVAYSAFGSSQAWDVDALVSAHSEQFVYDDRRRLSGDPIVGRAALQAASERLRQHYPHVETRTLAVRGERLVLASGRWSDDAGNQTTYLHLFEIGEDRLITYDGRFDEDDFESAYRELEKRYYAGEGAAFAEAGAVQVDWVTALNRGDLDRVGELYAAEMRVENRSRTGFPDRSANDLRASFAELNAMVGSTRTWPAVVCWVSPVWNVTRIEREAVAADNGQYEWTRLLVNEIRDGLVMFSCEFELEDEDAAFAYAEERVRATRSRLAVTNQSCEAAHAMTRAHNAHDIDGIMRCFSDRLIYDDRRRLSGDPVRGNAEFRWAFERVLKQYSHFRLRILAVRGDRLHLHRTNWSDDAGNESAYLHVFQTDDDGLLDYACRFDEDDFEDAFRELDSRYYAGEGKPFAECGLPASEGILALNRDDYDLFFGELAYPELHVENHTRSAFPDRSASDLRASLKELDAMVESARMWMSAVYWLSPNWSVIRLDREAVGRDGEQYEWTRLIVTEHRDGRFAGMREFEPEGEQAAFAYAEERVRAAASTRLAVTNRATQYSEAGWQAMKAHDVDAAVALYSDQFEYDDRRRLKGDPIDSVAAMRAGIERVLEQYRHFEWRNLAVRGNRLALSWSRWWDDAGNETTYLHLRDIGDDRRVTYDGRFDEDDFEGAYLELERRYYAGEGVASAEAGAVATGYAIALNRSEFDRAFGDLTAVDFRLENRSRSGFGDRSAAELRATYEDLTAMVASARIWYSALCWMSSTLTVGRFEREAVGLDGEHYTWTLIQVAEIRDGRVALACQFDLEDEAAAFAYAEERVRAASSRLAVTNRASASVEAARLAMRAHDVDGVVAVYSDRFEYDDRRRLSGGPRDTPAALRAAVELLLEQYPHFEWRTLAVRGERLGLHWSRWWDEAGNEAAFLHLFEVGDDGRVTYDGRFDEEDFEGAYRELERRYCAGEGKPFAEVAALEAEWLIAFNKGDFDRVFGELTDPGFRVEIRSASPFPDHSAAELRVNFEDLNAMFSSARYWNSAVCWLDSRCGVVRHERDAVGLDGEQYAWSRLYVFEASNGRAAWLCEFRLEDEAAAFACAEERMRAADSA